VIEVTGLRKLLDRFRRLPKRIDTGLADYIVDEELRPMAADMRSAAGGVGRHAPRAAQAMSVAETGNAGRLVARGPSNHTLYGAEYGGRKRGKRPYATRSRDGNAYIVRRRTTMQFLPNLGQRGYWYWPTARKDLRGIKRRLLVESVRIAESD
jgi:hypothetical protein